MNDERTKEAQSVSIGGISWDETIDSVERVQHGNRRLLGSLYRALPILLLSNRREHFKGTHFESSYAKQLLENALHTAAA